MLLDELEIRQEHCAFMKRGALCAEEEFRSPQDERVVAAIEGIAQDQMDEMIEEERRYLHSVANNREIGAFDRA
jgi:hypothetical protein